MKNCAVKWSSWWIRAAHRPLTGTCAVVGFVCVYLYICNACFLETAASQALTSAMQAKHNNNSNLIVSDFWFKALFSNYSVICSPWRSLREIQSQTWVETWKQDWWRLAAICLYAVQYSSNKRRGSIALIWTLASPSIVLLHVSLFSLTLPNSDLDKLLQLSLLLYC